MSASVRGAQARLVLMRAAELAKRRLRSIEGLACQRVGCGSGAPVWISSRA